MASVIFCKSQAQNVAPDEVEALSNLLNISLELPQAEAYRNDIPMPRFLSTAAAAAAAAPKGVAADSSSSMLPFTPGPRSAEAEMIEEDWEKLTKMVAGFSIKVFRTIFRRSL